MVRTVTEQIYQEIKKDIQTHKMKPGEKLTIKKLNEIYGVSSSPIREALTRLQQDGLIDYKPNIGMSVIVMTEKDINEIFLLTAEFDIIAMKGAYYSDNRDELLKELEHVIRQSKDVNSRDWNKLSDEFHLLFFKYADNSRLSEAAKKIRMQSTILSNAYEELEDNRNEIWNQHNEIFLKLKEGKVEEAEQMLRNHLMSSREKAIDVMSSLM